MKINIFDVQQILVVLEDCIKEHPKQSTRWNAMYLSHILRKSLMEAKP